MFILFINLFLSITRVFATQIIMGFQGTGPDDQGVQEITKAITEKKVDGVILFTYNITSSQQLKNLTSYLKQKGCKYVCIDQEGGKVTRLKSANGFRDFKTAQEISKGTEKEAKKEYAEMAQMLADHGVNFTFGPCVDLDTGKSSVISDYGRSYGKTTSDVIKFARIFIQEHESRGIKTSLKHYPGHTDGDTHNGFTVKKTYPEDEGLPYKELQKEAYSIMISHIVDEHFDKEKPASFSLEVIKYVKEKYPNLKTVSDDICMGALTTQYSVEKIIETARNMGYDYLIIGRNPNAIGGKEMPEEKKQAVIEKFNPHNVYKIIQGHKA
jgi:beta-N-acetylhexosaminidase